MRRPPTLRRRARLGSIGVLVTCALTLGLATATASTAAAASTSFAGFAASPAGGGFWTVTAGGVVTPGGSAKAYGDARHVALAGRIVGIAPTANGHGYWLVASDGGIFSYGNAQFFGSMGGKPLSRPVIGMAATPSGHGYWMFASDGGVFSFGDARFYGSTGAIKLKSPIVGMTARPDGHGYWLVASDGGVFAFKAHFYGSTGAIKLNAPIVGMLRTTKGTGYWLVASDGGVFSFGAAPFYGSTASFASPPRIVGIAARAQHKAGYVVVGSAGTTYEYGPGVPSAHQPTTNPGSPLPPDTSCAGKVKKTAEVRPQNTPFNMTKGHHNALKTDYSEFARVDGNYTGTTDEIIQWAACKWGIDEDIVRAQAVRESYWDQQNVGDFNQPPCIPGHANCPGTGGIMSVRLANDPAAFPDSMSSTAYNLDMTYASWRACYTGKYTWLGNGYAAGDAWGCVGVWFSGNWHSGAANTYIQEVKDIQAARTWTTANFKNYTHSG